MSNLLSFNVLFIDTETTGVPLKWDEPFTNLRNWPNLVQVYSELWKIERGQSPLILGEFLEIQRPDNFIIPQKATEIHGISHEMALEEGMPGDLLFSELYEQIKNADLVICHNYAFDSRIIAAELYRNLGLDFGDFFLRIPSYCTMEETKGILKIPNPNPKYKNFKWPSLQELHTYCFGEGFEKAHDAKVDVKATVKCFFHLINKEIFYPLKAIEAYKNL